MTKERMPLFASISSLNSDDVGSWVKSGLSKDAQTVLSLTTTCILKIHVPRKMKKKNVLRPERSRWPEKRAKVELQSYPKKISEV